MAGDIIGKVQSVQGVVQARDANRTLRRRMPDDTLRDGEVVLTGDRGKLVIQVADGGLVYRDPGQSVPMSDELPLSRFAGPLQAQDLRDDPLVRAVLGEGALEAMTEDTAAGPAGGAGEDGGHGFVQLLRVTEFADSPLGLTTTGLSPNPLLVEQTRPLAEPDASDNRVPLGTPLGDQTHFDGDVLGAVDDSKSFAAVDVRAAFLDPDGDSLTYSATGLPPGLTLDPVTGVIRGRVDPSASDQTNDDDNRQVYSVSVSVSVTVTVTATRRAMASTAVMTPACLRSTNARAPSA